MKQAHRNVIPVEVEALNATAHAVREHANTAASKAAIEHCLMLEKSYLDRLRTVSPQDLQHLQGSLAQATELRELLQGSPDTDGTV